MAQKKKASTPAGKNRNSLSKTNKPVKRLTLPETTEIGLGSAHLYEPQKKKR